MCSQQDCTETFALVDLFTAKGRETVVIPHIWYKATELVNVPSDASHECWFPPIEGSLLAERETPPDHERWIRYPCVPRKDYENFHAARAQLSIASLQSDIPDTEDEKKKGRGLRKKIPNSRYQPYVMSSKAPKAQNQQVALRATCNQVSSPNQQLTQVTPSKIVTHVTPTSQQLSQVTAISQQFTKVTPLSQQFTQVTPSHQSTQVTPSQQSTQFTPYQEPSEECNQVTPNQQYTLLTSSQLSTLDTPDWFRATQEHSQVVITPVAAGLRKHPSLAAYSSPVPPPIPHVLLNTQTLDGPAQRNNQQVESVGTDLPYSQTSSPSVGSKQTKNLTEVTLGKVVSELLRNREGINDVKALINNLERKIEALAMTPIPVVPQDKSNDAFLTEPLQVLEEVIPFEKSLDEPDNYYNLVRIIKSLGGNTQHDAVKRAWERVFSLQIMSQVNWFGHEKKGMKKHGLASSPITKAIKEAVKSKYIKFTDAEMQEETTDIMKNKPEKYREYLKKMKKNSEKENRSSLSVIVPSSESSSSDICNSSGSSSLSGLYASAGSSQAN